MRCYFERFNIFRSRLGTTTATKVFFLTMILLIVMASPIYAKENVMEDKWRELNLTSDKVLQLVKQQKYEEAKQLMEYFSKEFVTIHYDEYQLSMNDLRVITTSYDRAMEAVTSVSLNHEERVLLATEFRLVVDAIVTEQHPLWLNSKRTILTNIDRLTEFAVKGDNQGFQHQLNAFLRQYKMIRPALMLDLKPEEFQRLEAHTQFLERYRQQIVNDKDKQSQLQLLKEDFQRLYEKIEKDQADTSLLWVILSIGGMIIVSLSYVGWKKYKAERRREKMRL